MSLMVQDRAPRLARSRPAIFWRWLTQPSLGKKFFLTFCLLATASVWQWYLVETLLEKNQGIAVATNASGSLRWLSQRLTLETGRFVSGDGPEPAIIRQDLQRLDQILQRMLQSYLNKAPRDMQLPVDLSSQMTSIVAQAADLHTSVEQVLSLKAAALDYRPAMNQAYRDSAEFLARVDHFVNSLVEESVITEQKIKTRRIGLILVELATLFLVLLAIRFRIVVPLRELAALSTAFAKGQRNQRSNFRFFDEIGRLSKAFDSMADQIDWDFNQLADAHRALSERELELQKFALAIEHSPVAVLITDAQGRVEYSNSRFQEMTGYTGKEIAGKTPRFLHRVESDGGTACDEAACSRLSPSTQRGLCCQGELLDHKKDGTPFWENVRVAHLKNRQGEVVHFIVVLEDVTEQKQAQEAIIRMNAELEDRVTERTRQLSEINQELEAFSYSIAHDLRAPLRAINGFASLIEEDDGCRLSEGSRHLMARLKHNTLFMGELIDDLLALARVSHKEPVREALDLSAMARRILDDLAGAAPLRQRQLEVQEGVRVEGDAVLLQDMLENLLGNAWKFTGRCEVSRIDFGCRQEAEETVFFVRDNGAGFDMQYAEKLFSPFQRLHRAQEFEGTGIGLAIVQRVVSLHGGRIWADSTPGEGTCFSFTLAKKRCSASTGSK